MPRPGSDYLHKKINARPSPLLSVKDLRQTDTLPVSQLLGILTWESNPKPTRHQHTTLAPKEGHVCVDRRPRATGARDQLDGGSYPEPGPRSCGPRRLGLSAPTCPSSDPHPVHTTSQTCWKNCLTTKPPNKAPTHQAGPCHWRCRPSQLPAPQGDTGRLCGRQEKVGFPKDNRAAGGRLGQLPPAVGSPGPPVCTKTA